MAAVAVVGPVLAYVAGKTKNRWDDIAAAVANDDEARDLFEALLARVEEIRAEGAVITSPK